MDIEIRDCNNIDFAKITLNESKLNIKFAPNGTGKSTVARALMLGAKGGQDLLKELMPFKLRKDNPENKQPEVTGAGALQDIMCFDEEYVSQFVFKPDELLSNSFDIFVRTDAYNQKEQEIEELVRSIKQLFTGGHELHDQRVRTLEKTISTTYSVQLKRFVLRLSA